MSTLTDVRTVANKVRTVLGWLDDHPQLPDNPVVSVAGRAEVAWYPRVDGLNADEVARALEWQFGPGEVIKSSNAWSGTQWRPEGDRPALVVYGGIASREAGA